MWHWCHYIRISARKCRRDSGERGALRWRWWRHDLRMCNGIVLLEMFLRMDCIRNCNFNVETYTSYTPCCLRYPIWSKSWFLCPCLCFKIWKNLPKLADTSALERTFWSCIQTIRPARSCWNWKGSLRKQGSHLQICSGKTIMAVMPGEKTKEFIFWPPCQHFLVYPATSLTANR